MVELTAVPELRRDVALAGEDPLARVGFFAVVRVGFFAVVRVAFFAVVRAGFFAVEPALRLAPALPLDAAAARVWPLEREERGDAADVFLALAEVFSALAEAFLGALRWALLRAFVAALRGPPVPLLAVLPAVFRLVCF